MVRLWQSLWLERVTFDVSAGSIFALFEQLRLFAAAWICAVELGAHLDMSIDLLFEWLFWGILAIRFQGRWIWMDGWTRVHISSLLPSCENGGCSSSIIDRLKGTVPIICISRFNEDKCFETGSVGDAGAYTVDPIKRRAECDDQHGLPMHSWVATNSLISESILFLKWNRKVESPRSQTLVQSGTFSYLSTLQPK
jgi:hypothetical protein